jgi:hypothetical protein
MRPTSDARWVSERKTPRGGVFLSGVAPSASFGGKQSLTNKTTHDGDWRGAITRRSWLTLRFAYYSVASLLTNPASATKNLLGRSSGRFYFFTQLLAAAVHIFTLSPSAEEFFLEVISNM